MQNYGLNEPFRNINNVDPSLIGGPTKPPRSRCCFQQVSMVPYHNIFSAHRSGCAIPYTAPYHTTRVPGTMQSPSKMNGFVSIPNSPQSLGKSLLSWSWETRDVNCIIQQMQLSQSGILDYAGTSNEQATMGPTTSSLS